MKFLTLKFNKVSQPSLESLRPPLFNIGSFWLLCLALFVVVVLLTSFVGFDLFYKEYKEDHQEVSDESADELINVSRLKSVIEKRSNFINTEVPKLMDPSL